MSNYYCSLKNSNGLIIIFILFGKKDFQQNLMRDTSLRVMKSCFLLFRYILFSNSIRFLLLFSVFFFSFFLSIRNNFLNNAREWACAFLKTPSISFNFSRSIDIRLSKLAILVLYLFTFYPSFLLLIVLTITIVNTVFIKIHNIDRYYLFLLSSSSRFYFSLLNRCCYFSIFHLVSRKAHSLVYDFCPLGIHSYVN